jgi:alpha-tubulin suppressor-like RCC1 family protein
MMNKLSFVAVMSAMLLSACNPTPMQPNLKPSKAFGVLELNLNSDGASTASFEGNAQTRAVSIRENDVVFGTGLTQVIGSTNSAFDYLVATFSVTHTGSSSTDFHNLTLYALAKSGNVGDTAIKSITNFGGVTDPTEQTRLAKLLIPVHAVKVNGSGVLVMDNDKADFQAFTSAEVTDATTAAGSAITPSDTILNYGFSVRCTVICTDNSRLIAVNSEGRVSIALRVPKAANSTPYKFVMNFVVMDDNKSKVTRGVYPPESVGGAETRGAGVGANILTQFGLNVGATTLTSQTVDDVQTSSLGASIQALDIGRISANGFHSCGLTSTGSAYCWGDNFNGQLGNNSKLSSSIPVLVNGGLTFSSISAGDGHSCGVTTFGSAYCWGLNFYGQLGNNSNTDSSIPVLVQGGLTFSSISAGGFHSCGVTTSGSAYCWGYNSVGQLGNKLTIDSSIPVLVNGSLTFSSISAGSGHSCGLTSTGSAYCWGYNGFGQLGNNSTTNSSIPILVNGGLTFSNFSAGYYHSCGLTSAGRAYCWGYNGFGGLGNNSTTNSSIPVAVDGGLIFSSISAGGGQSCGLTFAGSAYCWGYNVSGQLGNNSTIDSNIPVLVKGDLTFSNISAGKFQLCGVNTSGSVYCWGGNSFGQLGNNSITNSSTPVTVINSLFNL